MTQCDDEISQEEWVTRRFPNRCYFYPGRDCPGWTIGKICSRIKQEIPREKGTVMNTAYMRLTGEVIPGVPLDQIHNVYTHSLRIVPSDNNAGLYIYVENYMGDDLSWFVSRITRLSFHRSMDEAGKGVELWGDWNKGPAL